MMRRVELLLRSLVVVVLLLLLLPMLQLSEGLRAARDKGVGTKVRGKLLQ
jgi:competence protein ComGC